MDTAILSSVIGASAVMLAAMMGVVLGRIFNALSETNRRIDGIYDVLRGHGERLARIELKLGADPPPEAA